MNKDYRSVPDEEADRSYDAEPEPTQLATEEARRVRSRELAYPVQPGR